MQRDVLHDADRDVSIGHVDVHLRTADVLLADQELVLVLHPFVTGAGRDVAAVQVDQRNRAGCHHAQSERISDLVQPATQPVQLGAQLVEALAGQGVGLDQGALQLRCERAAIQLGKHGVDRWYHSSGLPVNEVELLLGTDP